MDTLKFISDVGFPIAAACLGIYFVYLSQKFLLDGVLDKIKSLITIIRQLDARVTSMSEDIHKIDELVNKALHLPEENN